MAEYIKKLTMRNCCIDEDGQTDEPIIKKLNEVIDFINSIDVSPVRHGRWILDEKRYVIHCSECGEVSGYSLNLRDVREENHYCPNCWCKMDLEEAQNGKQS